MKRRKWSADEKLAIVLMGIKGEKSVAQICREHHISQVQYYKWREKFLEGGKNALAFGAANKKEAQLKAEIEKLQKIIGKQTVYLEILKKETISKWIEKDYNKLYVHSTLGYKSPEEFEEEYYKLHYKKAA